MAGREKERKLRSQCNEMPILLSSGEHNMTDLSASVQHPLQSSFLISILKYINIFK